MFMIFLLKLMKMILKVLIIVLILMVYNYNLDDKVSPYRKCNDIYEEYMEIQVEIPKLYS